MKKINMFLLALLLGVAFISGGVWADEGEGETGSKIVVGVMPFVSDEVNTRGVLARDVLSQVLANSKRVAAIKQDIIDDSIKNLNTDTSALDNVKTVAEVGQRAGAQYMLIGKVVKVGQKNKTRGKGFLFARTRETTLSANAELNVKVIDVNASKIVMDLSGYGSARELHSTKKGIGLSFGGLLGGIANAVEAAGNIKASTMKTESANEAAVADAAFDLGNKVKSELAGEYVAIRAVKDKDNIEINADSSAGVNEEDLYLVYLDGAEKRDKNGILTDREKLPVAVVKVDRIHRGYSVAKSVSSGGDASLIRKGDKTEPISKERSKELTSGKKFIKERPKTPSVAYSALFNKNAGPVSVSPRETVTTQGLDTQSTPKQASSALSPSTLSPAAPNRLLENSSTDPSKVIATYPLAPGEVNTRRIAHLNASKLKGQKAYDKYVELANSYSGDYLAAYQAGKLAQQLKKDDDAKVWYDKALTVNSNYKPAQDAREKMK
jgi:curli biogenesis system outer membrane secretion channel CsgG